MWRKECVISHLLRRVIVVNNASVAEIVDLYDAGQAVGTAWTGYAATKVSSGLFSINAPAGATKYIVNNNAGQQTQDLKLILGSTNKIEFYGNKNARPVTPTELHIEAPTRWSDVYVHYWYTYTFTGWDTDFSSITKDTVVTATYSSAATTAGKIGYLEVKVTGGTNFNMSIGVSDTKPRGTSYVNPRMELGVTVTVTAETTNGNKFIGWMDAKNGYLLTTSLTYSFNTSGNDVLVALYDTDLDDKGIVTFRNDKTNQVIDIQYYSSTDTIVFPEDISFPGYEFMGWNATQAEIQAKLSEGVDVTVLPVWRNEDVYFSITVNGGSITDSPKPVDGKYVGYKGTTVTANKAPDGKMFAYWTDKDGNVLSYSPEYKFYPYENTVLTAKYISTTALGVDIIGTKTEPESVETPAETFKVYFENNWMWTDVCIYYWGVEGEPAWHGVPMKFF